MPMKKAMGHMDEVPLLWIIAPEMRGDVSEPRLVMTVTAELTRPLWLAGVLDAT